MVCSVKPMVIWFWPGVILELEFSMVTKRPALAGLVQAKLYNHDLQNSSPLNLLETTLIFVF